MGTNTIGEAVDGTPIPASDHNAVRTAWVGDIVPRNSSAVATDQAASVGTSALSWLNGYIRKLWIGDPANDSVIEAGTNSITMDVDGVKKFDLHATNGFDGQYMKASSIPDGSLADNSVNLVNMKDDSVDGSNMKLVTWNGTSGSTVNNQGVNATLSGTLATPTLLATLTLTTKGGLIGISNIQSGVIALVISNSATVSPTHAYPNDGLTYLAAGVHNFYIHFIGLSSFSYNSDIRIKELF